MPPSLEGIRTLYGIAFQTTSVEQRHSIRLLSSCMHWRLKIPITVLNDAQDSQTCVVLGPLGHWWRNSREGLDSVETSFLSGNRLVGAAVGTPEKAHREVYMVWDLYLPLMSISTAQSRTSGTRGGLCLMIFVMLSDICDNATAKIICWECYMVLSPRIWRKPLENILSKVEATMFFKWASLTDRMRLEHSLVFIYARREMMSSTSYCLAMLWCRIKTCWVLPSETSP